MCLEKDVPEDCEGSTMRNIGRRKAGRYRGVTVARKGARLDEVK